MRQAADIEIALKPRPDGIPLQRWLYDEIRTAILSGGLMPGSRLPATRDLALRLKISRGTVLAVYAQLGAEGYIRSATGKGSFVAPELPDLPPRTFATGRGGEEPIGRKRHRRQVRDAGRGLVCPGQEAINDAVQRRRAHFAG